MQKKSRIDGKFKKQQQKKHKVKMCAHFLDPNLGCVMSKVRLPEFRPCDTRPLPGKIVASCKMKTLPVEN